MYAPRRTRPRRAAAPKLSRFSAEVLAGLAKKTRYVDPALAEQWPKLAGETLAGLSRPGKLIGHGRGRTLEIHVPNGAAAAAAQMEIDGLLTRLGGHFGPGVVSRIAVLQSGGDVACAPARVVKTPGAGPDRADDGPLGAALASFRSAVRRRDGMRDDNEDTDK